MRRFQRRLALLDDGLVGGRTLWALNMDNGERRRIVAENMERLRWMPRRLESEHIVVNMAGYDLTVVKGGQQAMTMKVVVGRPFRQTPIMRSDITDLVLNPFWNAPEKLAKEDLFPSCAATRAISPRKAIACWPGGARPPRKCRCRRSTGSS